MTIGFCNLAHMLFFWNPDFLQNHEKSNNKTQAKARLGFLVEFFNKEN